MRILLAGLGAIGQRHARNLRALRGDGVELIAYRRRRLRHVVTESLARDDTRDVETELGLTVFSDLDEALAARPHAVFVCTPSSQHLEIAQRAAEAGCHLFVEKPLSHSFDGVERLRATVASNDVVAMVGCQWRFHPCVRALRQLLAAGTFGRIERAEVEYAEYLPDWHPYEDYRTSYAARAELGGGVVLTQIHDYDLAYWLFGPPSRATASGGRMSDLEIDVEDTANALLEGDGPPVRVLQMFASRLPTRTITVTGERCTATADLFRANVTFDPPLAPDFALPEYQRNDMFVGEAAQFLDCIDGRAEPACTLDDGISVLRVALAVKESMRTGQTVQIP